MTTPARHLWTRLPITLRAIIAGFLIAAVAANVWLLLLLNLGVQLAALVEAIFLAFFLLWARGAGPPRASRVARAKAFRHDKLASKQWLWGLVPAVFFAPAVQSSIVLLFRVVYSPCPAAHPGSELSVLA